MEKIINRDAGYYDKAVPERDAKSLWNRTLTLLEGAESVEIFRDDNGKYWYRVWKIKS